MVTLDENDYGLRTFAILLNGVPGNRSIVGEELNRVIHSHHFYSS
jgi:hypothetical protein